MRPQRFQLLLTCALLLLPVGITRSQGTDYKFQGIPATIEEFDLAFPVKGNFTGQVDLQTVTQGAHLNQNKNPFAYWQRAHVRPWLQYNGFKNKLLAVSVSWMKRYSIPPLGNKRGDEVRFTFLSTFTQPKSWGSFYEQMRGEVKNNKTDGATNWTHTPRFRFRLGQNFKVKEAHHQQIIVYEEIMVKYKQHSKGFDILRFFGGYSYNKNPRWAFTVGFISQFQLRSNNTDVDFYFGPSLTVRYFFGKPKHPLPPPDPDID